MHGTHLEDLTTKLKPKAASSLLLWIIVAFVVAFFVWAGFTELDRTVRGQGRVVPSSQLQVVSNMEGGVVQDILVRAGQNVRQGDELIRLDRTASGAEFGSGSATVLALQVKIARLTAEVTGTAPQYPASNDPSVADQIRVEQSLHAARMANLSALTSAGQARMGQASRAVGEAESSYQSRVSAWRQRQMEANMIRPLVERGIEPRLSLVQAEAQASIAQTDMQAASETIGRARQALAEARSAMAQQREEWLTQSGTELATAQAEFAARQRSLPALADRAQRTVLRAPLAGRINRVLVSTRGGTIRPGEPVVEIVPSNESLVIEAQVRPSDIAFVRIGQPAHVAITAYDRSVYGVLDGVVTTISPDATLNERTGESYYTVKVRTSVNFLRDTDGRQMPIGVGMTAEVDLLGEKRTILQYILSPISRLGETALREQ
jgi:membrane fusion protein, adhesin transport system